MGNGSVEPGGPLLYGRLRVRRAQADPNLCRWLVSVMMVLCSFEKDRCTSGLVICPSCHRTCPAMWFWYVPPVEFLKSCIRSVMAPVEKCHAVTASLLLTPLILLRCGNAASSQRVSRTARYGPMDHSLIETLMNVLRCLRIVRFRSSQTSAPHALAVIMQFPALLRFRPVRPAPSAWHEMPGYASPSRRRPARAALSRIPPCFGWSA